MLFSFGVLLHSMLYVPRTLFFASILVSSFSIMPYTLAQGNAHAPSQTETGLFLAPGKQIARSVMPDSVICSDDFLLIKEPHENIVACVKPQTAQNLVERGWKIIRSQTQVQNIISREQADALLHKYYNNTCVGCQAMPYAFFAFMEYNGTQDDHPRFVIYDGYQPDAETAYIADKRSLVFDDNSAKYLSDKLTDRFIWIVGFHSSLPIFYYFVDAKTGEVIGRWNTCTGCV